VLQGALPPESIISLKVRQNENRFLIVEIPENDYIDDELKKSFQPMLKD
jgi:hypothetical protein